MRVVNIKLKNWRNFKDIDVSLAARTFIVGPNASGKSNFLEVFRFMRDVASGNGGGLQSAIKSRGGISKIRSLAATRQPNVKVELHLGDADDAPEWRYLLEFGQEKVGARRPIVIREEVYSGKSSAPILKRPDKHDEKDRERLTQTHLEQVNSNQEFRQIADFFGRVVYLHLVPQLLKHADQLRGSTLENDPFGQGFLERIASCGEQKRKRRLMKIQNVLSKAVPQLEELQFERDQTTGNPHLKAKYAHWRVNGAWQREDQFSDGTLRLIGLFWVLQEEPGLLLLEEPELSLNEGIVSLLAPFIHQLQGNGQVLVTTHSSELLSDSGIGLDEVLLLQTSGGEATTIRSVTELADVKQLVGTGYSMGGAVLPHATPKTISLLSNV
jgi:predicted ATPase